MKTWQEVLDRLRAELNQWFIKQCRNTLEDYYLYYRPTTEEADGGFLFSLDKPSSAYLLGWNERVNKGATVDQNFKVFSKVLRRLPIMSLEA